MLHLRSAFLCVGLSTIFFPLVGHCSLITANANMTFVTSNANASTTNSAFGIETGFDGLLNSAGTNGAVFDLTSQNPSSWIVDFSNVATIDTLLLYQLVGGFPDNGVQDFTLEVFSDANGTGSLLLNQSFTATLNQLNTAESFELSSVVSNPGSLIFTVTSAFGNESRAEFSEVQFNGTINTVPEPTTLMIWGGLGLGLAFSGRRRRA